MFKRLVNIIIGLYQITLSPDQGFFKGVAPTCRFYPSCSEYARQAIVKYGLWLGGFKGLKRLSRCHFFHPGGYDPLL